MSLRITLSLLSLLCFSQCGGGGEKVSGTARVLKGAKGEDRRKKSKVSTRPDQKWLITPDKVKVTINKFRFNSAGGDNQEIAVTGCEVEFKKETASLEKVLDCNIDVPVGTWSSITVGVESVSQIYLNDSENNFYTTSSEITRTNPGRALDYFSFTPEFNSESEAYLPSPLVVAKGDTPTISVIGDLTHTARISATATTATINVDWASQSVPVQLLPVAGTPSKIAFYSASGTADSFDQEAHSPYPGTPGNHSGATEIRIFYTGDAPTGLFLDSGNVGGTFFCGDTRSGNADGGKRVSSATASSPTGGGTGGYLGRDSNGKISWARASSFDWTNYTSVFTMPELTTIGDTGTLECGAVTSDPKPSSGDTYASGPPTFTVDATSVLTLVAQ